MQPVVLTLNQVRALEGLNALRRTPGPRTRAGTVPVPLSGFGYAYAARSTPSEKPTVSPSRLEAIRHLFP
jgi:hypothetical protein